MKRKLMWSCLGVLITFSLIISNVGCQAPAATPAPKATPGSSTAPAPAKPQVIKLRGQMAYVSGAPMPDRFKWHGGLMGTSTFDVLWKEWLEAHSGGRLQLDLAQPNAIVPIPDMMTAVEKGTLDFAAHTAASNHAGIIPEANIETGLPFAWETPIEAWDCFYNWGLKEELEKVYAERNIWPSFVPIGDVYALNANFDISSPDNIKGKKIRALALYGDYVKALGGTPTSIPVTDLYMALKLGTVDGYIFGLSGQWGYKMYEVVKYLLIDPNPSTVVVSFYFNLNSLKALPDDLRKLIMGDTEYITHFATYQNASNIRYFGDWSQAKGGIKLVRWTGADRQKAYDTGIGLWDKIASLSPRCAKLVDIVKAQARDYGKIK